MIAPVHSAEKPQTPDRSIAASQKQAFENLKMLEGTYQELDEEASAKVVYQIISRGSALTETWYMPSGKVELTVFYLDNGALLATHYCAAGIQSTMKLQEINENGFYDFKIISATNMPSSEAAHNSGFGYRFTDISNVHRTEFWTEKNQQTESALTLERIN